MSNSYTTCMQHARNIQQHVAHSVHVACRYCPGNMLPKMQHACHNNNSKKNKNRFCSSLSQTCVGSCDSLSQPCTKIPVCDKVLPDCHNLETRLLIACFLYTSLLQPCHMLVQPCHFCMGCVSGAAENSRISHFQPCFGRLCIFILCNSCNFQ